LESLERSAKCVRNHSL